MTPVAVNILGRAGETLGGFLPRLGGAIALLIIGVLLARLVGRLLRRLLERVGLDELAKRARVAEVLERAGLGPSLSHLIGRAIRIALTIVVIFAALSLLGLQFLSQSLNEGVLLLPKLLVAAALLLAGVVLGGYARTRLERLSYQMDFPLPVAYIAQIIVVAIFAITAAAQIAVSTIILLTIVGIVLAGVASTFALAFGLGGREVARAVSAGRYVRQDYAIGQEITIDSVRGRISAIEATSVLLDAGAGRTVRVPNHLFLETLVTVHAAGPEDER